MAENRESLPSGSRMLWVTNFAAPYRRPVWSLMALQTDLTVALLASSEERRTKRGNRGDDWFKDGGGGYSVRHIRNVRLHRGEGVYYVGYWGLRRLLRGCDAVLLGGWESPVYWQLLALAKIRGVRTVGFYESTSRSQRHSTGVIARLRQYFFCRLDAIVTPGTASTDALIALHVPAERILTGFNAVDVRWIAEEVQNARALLPKISGHRFLYVGQLIDRKNVRSLLTAFDRVRQPGDRLEVVGVGEDHHDLRRMTELLGMDDAVSFSGGVAYANLPQVLARNHTLVLPSTEEVWGLVVNEALAGGLHAVVSRLCGVADSVQGMGGVYLCDTTAVDIGAQMAASRQEWAGWLSDPEILNYGPAAFAGTFLQALHR